MSLAFVLAARRWNIAPHLTAACWLTFALALLDIAVLT